MTGQKSKRQMISATEQERRKSASECENQKTEESAAAEEGTVAEKNIVPKRQEQKEAAEIKKQKREKKKEEIHRENEEKDKIRKIRISVRQLVEFILRSGDIDDRAGGNLPDYDAMQEGSRLHRKIQGKMGAGYRAEVPLSVSLPGNGYILIVEGRADGIFREDIWYIDEIKTMYREVETLEGPYELHLAQAKCYAYIYLLQNDLEKIGVQMTYCTQET